MPVEGFESLAAQTGLHRARHAATRKYNDRRTAERQQRQPQYMLDDPAAMAEATLPRRDVPADPAAVSGMQQAGSFGFGGQRPWERLASTLPVLEPQQAQAASQRQLEAFRRDLRMQDQMPMSMAPEMALGGAEGVPHDQSQGYGAFAPLVLPVTEMTGLESVRRSARAFASGDPQTGMLEGGGALLGLMGDAALIPRGPRAPRVGPMRNVTLLAEPSRITDEMRAELPSLIDTQRTLDNSLNGGRGLNGGTDSLEHIINLGTDAQFAPHLPDAIGDDLGELAVGGRFEHQPLLGSPDIAADPLANVRRVGMARDQSPFPRMPTEDRRWPQFGRPQQPLDAGGAGGGRVGGRTVRGYHGGAFVRGLQDDHVPLWWSENKAVADRFGEGFDTRQTLEADLDLGRNLRIRATNPREVSYRGVPLSEWRVREDLRRAFGEEGAWADDVVDFLRGRGGHKYNYDSLTLDGVEEAGVRQTSHAMLNNRGVRYRSPARAPDGGAARGGNVNSSLVNSANRFRTDDTPIPSNQAGAEITPPGGWDGYGGNLMGSGMVRRLGPERAYEEIEQIFAQRNFQRQREKVGDYGAWEATRRYIHEARRHHQIAQNRAGIRAVDPASNTPDGGALEAGTPREAPNGGGAGGVPYLAQLREQGFNTDMRLYHGTQSDFADLRPSFDGDMGPGFYFHVKPEVANVYTRPIRPTDPNQWGGSIRPMYVRGRIGEWDAPELAEWRHRIETGDETQWQPPPGYAGVRSPDGTVVVFDSADLAPALGTPKQPPARGDAGSMPPPDNGILADDLPGPAQDPWSRDLPRTRAPRIDTPLTAEIPTKPTNLRHAPPRPRVPLMTDSWGPWFQHESRLGRMSQVSELPWDEPGGPPRIAALADRTGTQSTIDPRLIGIGAVAASGPVGYGTARALQASRDPAREMEDAREEAILDQLEADLAPIRRDVHDMHRRAPQEGFRPRGGGGKPTEPYELPKRSNKTHQGRRRAASFVGAK